MKKILLLSALALLALSVTFYGADDEGFRPLFNGKNLTGWKLRRPDGHASWSVKDGLLIV